MLVQDCDLVTGLCPRCQRPGKTHWRRNCKIVPRSPLPCGPGCQLRKLLKEIGFTESGCGCAEMAAKMDRWGPAGCIEHMAEILDHLQAEAVKRKQSFDRGLVEIAVLMAIGRAEEAV